MWPILPFIAGMAVGASALKLVRKTQANPCVREATENAKKKIRQAAVSGLDTLQHSSGRWRDRLAGKDSCCETGDACSCAQATAPDDEQRKSRNPKKATT